MSITICHLKDFTNAYGIFTAESNGKREVAAGEIIAHVGGNCCAGQTPVTEKAKEGNWCHFGTTTYSSAFLVESYPTPCGDPYTLDTDCECQAIEASGNTSGAHIHVSFHNSTEHNLLKCMVDGTP